MISIESIFKIAIGFVFGLLWVSLLMFSYASTDADWNIANVVGAIGAIATGLSAFMALIALVWSFVKHRSQTLAKEAILNLERAFEVLTQGSEENEPASDRLLWLTVARHIRSFEKTKGKLQVFSDPTQFDILCSHEEYWRSKFYTSLRGLNNLGFPENFFHDPRKKIDGDQLAPSSLAVVYSFSMWPEGQDDPLEGVEHLKLFNDSKILLLNPGLKNYLISRFRSYKNNFMDE